MRAFSSASASAIVFALALSSAAAADPVTLRMAAVAPEGTAWARELRAFSRDVETKTQGEVRFKWYLGAIAGDELVVLDRIKRGQLDGTAGSMFCERLAPSLRATRALGLFRSREEVIHVLTRLKPTLEDELDKSGFVGMIADGFGDTLFMTRDRPQSLADLKRGRWWIWSLDEVPKLQLAEMGFHSVGTPVWEAARAFDEGRSDGYLSIPTAALAFQWSAQVRFWLDVPMGFLPGCLVITHAAVDALPIAHQAAIRESLAHFQLRFEDIGRAQHTALLGGVFEKQGIQRVFTAELRDGLYVAADAARERLGERLAPAPLMKRITGWLDELRKRRAR